MRIKESSNATNRKLKDFYERYTARSDVSVFTMAENAAHAEIFLGPTRDKNASKQANPFSKKSEVD